MLFRSRDVDAELRFRPDIDERDIAVKVNNAVVALTAFTRTYLDKQRAEDAVKRIFGVAGVANDIASGRHSGAAPRSTPIRSPSTPMAARSLCTAACDRGLNGRRRSTPPGLRPASPGSRTRSRSAWADAGAPGI